MPSYLTLSVLPRSGLTIIKHTRACDDDADRALPSVKTCSNYLKLPPYSNKEALRERLTYAMVEGQGSFQLS